MFKKSSGASRNKEIKDYWKVLIVDDEPEVHTITKLALRDTTFNNKGVRFFSAYSGEEAKKKIKEVPDFALIFLDVVMETDDAGLKVVEFVREELNNKFIRIILRTGQPGQAPARDVILSYDINDYKEKTALDSDKLFIATYAALRSYHDIVSINRSRLMLDRYRIGLEEVITSSARLFEIRSMKQFASGLLYQLASLLHLDKESLLVRCNSCMVVKEGDDFEILAATGNIHNENGYKLSDSVVDWLNKALKSEKSVIEQGKFVGYFPTQSSKICLLYIDGLHEIDDLDNKLLQIFITNVSIAFDNLYLNQELYDTQMEIIDTLGDVVETRSKETANHVRRVAKLSQLLASKNGLSREQCELLFVAAPMHDIGKVAVPDNILLKPDKLSPEEWTIMKTHTQIGEDIFSQSKRPALNAAAIVAGQHHEKYDGTGYPSGLKGEDIHIFARIVALADVFDALVHRRCYKDAWPLEKALDLLKEQRGKHFDPNLVDILIENLDEAKAILQDYPEAG